MILFHRVNIYLFRNQETGFGTNIDKTFSHHSIWGVDVESEWRRGGDKWIWAFTVIIAGLEPDSVFLLLMYNYRLILLFKSNQTSYIRALQFIQSANKPNFLGQLDELKQPHRSFVSALNRCFSLSLSFSPSFFYSFILFVFFSLPSSPSSTFPFLFFLPLFFFCLCLSLSFHIT